MKKNPSLALLIIILIAFFLRFYRISAPLADWHSWRQADTAAVSRNFIKFGFDILHPRFDDLSNIPSGKDNPQGYRFVEFPFYNIIHAFLAKNIPIFPLEVWGRLISIFCSLLSLIFLYLIVKKLINEPTALLSALFFAVLPFNVYYSRVILPEPMMLMTMLASIWFWIKNQKTFYFLLSVFFGIISVLLKPFVLFFIFPSLFFLVSPKNQSRFLLSVFCYLFFVISPFLLWRWWAGHFPEGIPANLWLLNAGNIRFRPSWFYWLFAQRLARLILGYWGVVFFALGLVVKKSKKESWFFYSWLLGGLFYLIIIARGNIQHDYYQLILIPLLCVFLAKGVKFILTPPKGLNLYFCYLLSAVCFLFMIGFSWFQVRDFFNINNYKMVLAGRQADKILPPSAKVIAPLGGDTAFLYQTNRQGWPQGIEIDKLIKKGAEYYVNFNFGPETEYIEKNFCVLEKTPDFIIAKLSQCKQ